MFPLDLGDGGELRLLLATDAADLFALIDRNRAYLRRWMPWVDGTQSVADTAGFVHRALEGLTGTGLLACGVWQNDALCGVIDFHEMDPVNHKALVGYWLSEDRQGHGLMTRAVRAWVSHGFARLGFHRIEIQVAVGNLRSCAIPERLGFVREGVLRQVGWLYDHFEDHVVYSMLARDWDAG